MSAGIILDRAAPAATITGCPADPSNAMALNVDVGGTGVSQYRYKFGISADCTNTAGYSALTSVGANITDTLTGDGTYMLCVLGQGANLQPAASATSCTWTKDTSGPTAPISLDDGTWSSSTSATPTVSWTASTDALGTVASYVMAIGTTLGGTQTLNWTDIGNVTSYSRTGLALVDGTTYYVSVRAIDNAGNAGVVANGDGFTVDATALGAPTSLNDQNFWNAITETPTVTWAAPAAGGAPVSYYEFAIGSTAGGTDVLNYTNISNITSYQRTGVTLNNETRYYISVRAVDAAGNVGAVATSDGWDARMNVTTTQRWVQQAYIKAANAQTDDNFGLSISISGDTLAVGALGEDSNQTTITNGTTASSDNSSDDSGAAYVYKRTGTTWAQEAYIKAANAEAWDGFGASVTVSGDTLAVGALGEDSNQTTITNGATASGDNSASLTGAVYIYKRNGTTWAQEAYIKAANAESDDFFSEWISVAGDTLAVAAKREDSNQTTITNGTAASGNNSATWAGAVYVYKRTGISWEQQAYIKAVNARAQAYFGGSVSVFGDTLAVGSWGEFSNQTTITNGITASGNVTAHRTGAVYVYKRTGDAWAQEAYIKAANSEGGDDFGLKVSLYGNTLAVGAQFEDSNQTTITNGATASSDNSFSHVGAVYVYKRTGATWAQEAYVKAANADWFDQFGSDISVSNDTMAVGAKMESSNQSTITNGDTASTDNSLSNTGAVYVYRRNGTTWAQEAYIKAVNRGFNDEFGYSVSLSNDTLAVGARGEASNQTTITNGTTASGNNSAANAGAVYVYHRESIGDMNQDSVDERVGIHQQAYIKAANAEAGDEFGMSISISGDTLAVGARGEDSNQTTITNGTTASSDNSATEAGAVYVYKRTGTTWSQEAYLKAANAEAGDEFGREVSLSGDTLAVGAPGEASNQTTITNGTTASSNNSAIRAGAVYVYKRGGTTWAQEAYIKAANTEAVENFGKSVSVAGDTLAVGAPGEDSNQTTITNGTTASGDNSAYWAGAVYVYKRTGTTWAQEAYIKAANAEAYDFFGASVTVSGDTLAVGASSESSNQTTITNGITASGNNSAADAGAVYVYKRTGATWAQEAYVKAANAEAGDYFGGSLSLYGDTLAVGASSEDSNQTTITNGTTASPDNSASNAGAVYVYKLQSP